MSPSPQEHNRVKRVFAERDLHMSTALYPPLDAVSMLWRHSRQRQTVRILLKRKIASIADMDILDVRMWRRERTP